MYHYIYKIINNINNKYYLGKHSTNNLDNGYLGSGILLKKAITKYGKENFTKEILAYCDSESDCYELEELVATQIEVNNPMCYNITIGGTGFSIGHKVLPETKIKMSKAGSGENNAMYGKSHTYNTKLKMSNIKKGKYTKELNHMYNKSHTSETKLKMKNKHANYKGLNNPRCMKVAKLDKNTLEILKTYNYIKLAELDGFNPGHISTCCKGKRQTHGGFK